MKRIKIVIKDKFDIYWSLVWGDGTGHRLPNFNPNIERSDKIIPPF